MDYKYSFENRVKNFLYAVNTYPDCLEFEFKAIIEELDLKDGDIVLNLGGGGLDINKYIDKNIKYIPVDFCKEFSKLCNIDFTEINKLNFEDKSVDKIVILALLHHFKDEERTQLYKECYRVLKDDGKFIVADVLKDSNQDTWLNTIVNLYNPFGHNGKFFTKEDSFLLTLQNFVVETKIKNYFWWFNNKFEMCDYLKNLFYLQNINDDELISIVNYTLFPFTFDNKIQFKWKLIYFICTK